MHVYIYTYIHTYMFIRLKKLSRSCHREPRPPGRVEKRLGATRGAQFRKRFIQKTDQTSMSTETVEISLPALKWRGFCVSASL